VTDVFISYAKANAPAVRPLADAVKRLGYSVWWDEELPPHLSYSDVIADRIAAAKAAIVVWSEAAAASQWVRAEADAARNQNKLIQTSIDGRMPPMPFNQIQFAAIGDWQGEDDHPGWNKVKASLEALVGPRESAAASTPPAAAAPAPVAAPAPHKRHRLLIAVIAVAFLFIAGAGLFAWLRGGAPPATPAAARPAPVPPRAAAAPVPRPQPAAATPARTARVAPARRQSAKPARAQISPRLGEMRRTQRRALYGRRR
jgi:hypothetical protein